MNRITKLMILLVVAFFISMAAFAQAATFTVEFNAADTFNVDSFTIWFLVDDQFSYDNFMLGDAVPTAGMLGWEVDSNAICLDTMRGRVLKIGAYDQDGLFLSSPHYLTNGLLFSFHYSGSAPTLSDVVQFNPGDGSNLYPQSIAISSYSDSGITFAAVPIPATAILFLSGIFGMVGIRRFKGGQGES